MYLVLMQADDLITRANVKKTSDEKHHSHTLITAREEHAHTCSCSAARQRHPFRPAAEITQLTASRRSQLGCVSLSSSFFLSFVPTSSGSPLNNETEVLVAE